MTTDGLGFEEVNQSVTSTAIVSGTNVYGTTSVQSAEVSGTNVYATQDVGVGNSIQAVYADSEGTQISNITAEAIISGGMWVVGSSASGTTVSPVAKPAPANTPQPLGICLADTASGSSPAILTQGFYKGSIAEATLNQGAGFSMGSGTKLNTIGDAKAGYTRGTMVMGAGSEDVAGVYLW